jgi:predicted amidohydrolase YtcJ
MKALYNLVLISLAVVAIGLWLAWKNLNPQPPTTQVWINGEFITANEQNATASAIAIEEDTIVAVGDRSDVQQWVEAGATTIDLKGRAVLPGFIEAHGHFPGVGLYAIFADLNAPPIGNITNIPDLLSQLAQQRDAGANPIVGMGYDDSQMQEHRHPTRAELDSVSTDTPIYIIHISGHMGVLNSAALAAEGIDESTPEPAGGEIKRDDNAELNGLLTETAFIPLFLKLTQLSSIDQLRVTLDGVKKYAAQGYTTVQNGLANRNHIRGLRLAKKIGVVPQRVVVWPNQETTLKQLDGDIELPASDGKHFFVGARKFQADGSIQGYTGHLSQPYHIAGHGHASGYRGFAAINAATLSQQVSRVHCAGQQTAIHGNGDATIDNILTAWEQAQSQCPQKDLRHILIHAQTIRSDQLLRMAALNSSSGLNVSPSYHIVHPYYWGDRHQRQFLGPDRAQRISPTAETLASGLRFSTHLDAPVVPVDSTLRLWAPVSRNTHGGDTLGPEQTVDVMQSIRAMTIDAAWQMHLDADVGSIEVGKYADLVVLDKNPLTVPSNELRSIQIMQTVVGGVPIYSRP